jgi:hypothetical protein
VRLIHACGMRNIVNDLEASVNAVTIDRLIVGGLQIILTYHH